MRVDKTMNQLKETLASIRRQKKLYTKRVFESNEPQEQYDLSKKIMVLEEEESKILKELGVDIDSHNRFKRKR